MESTAENDVKEDKQYLTSYYRKYYLANREKLLARSKQRYAERVKAKEAKETKEAKEEKEADFYQTEGEEIFVIDDVQVPNKTTIEKLKELFSSDTTKII